MKCPACGSMYVEVHLGDLNTEEGECAKCGATWGYNEKHELTLFRRGKLILFS